MGGVAAPQRRPSLPCPSGAWSWLVPWSTALLQTNCAPPVWLLPSIWAAVTKSANRKTENPNKPHGFLHLRPETALPFLPSNVCRGARSQCPHPSDPASRYWPQPSWCPLPPLLSTAPCPITPSAKLISSASAATKKPPSFSTNTAAISPFPNPVPGFLQSNCLLPTLKPSSFPASAPSATAPRTPPVTTARSETASESLSPSNSLTPTAP